MLQKLENVYLAILRTVVIITSGLLLVGAVMFGFGSLKGFGDGPGTNIKPPEMTSDAIIKTITSPKSMSDEPFRGHKAETPEKITIDKNQKYYEAAADAIVSFVERMSYGVEGVDKERVVDVTKGRAEVYESEELVTAYAKGFAKAVPKILADKKIESLARNTSAIDVVNQVLNTYTKEFNDKIDAEHKRIADARDDHLQAKADSVRNLSLAGACFGLFLLVVFLSVFIKIERNLRNLEKPRQPVA